MSDYTIDDETLRSYLADALPARDLARVEKALRDSSELRARFNDIRQDGSKLIDDESLRSFLADALPAEELTRVEKALRDSAELRERLDQIKQNRADPNLHTLGAVWRRNRLTCPSRQQLGSYVLDVLDPDLANYLKFHIEVVECPFCEANLVDIRERETKPSSSSVRRHTVILKSIQDLMGDDNGS